MNWAPVKNQPNALLQEFRLMQDTDCKMVLKYNPHQHSVRFTSDDKQHQLFYFEGAETIGSKMQVMDQYGMERGNVSFDKTNDIGIMVLEGKRYYYQVKYSTSSLPLLTLYKNNPAQPWLSCNFNISGDETITISFVLGLCWYIFLQEEKQAPVEYAA